MDTSLRDRLENEFESDDRAEWEDGEVGDFVRWYIDSHIPKSIEHNVTGLMALGHLLCLEEDELGSIFAIYQLTKGTEK